LATDSLEEFLAGIDEEGTHECIVDNVQLVTSSKDGRVWSVFKYVVEDENSDINGEELSEMYQDFSHLKKDDLKDFTASERTAMRRAVRRKQERLESLGVSEDKLNNFSDWDSLAGLRVSVVVEVSSSTKEDENGRPVKTKYVNVRSVTLL
jgi:hypothetical protein